MQPSCMRMHTLSMCAHVERMCTHVERMCTHTCPNPNLEAARTQQNRK